MPTQSNSVSITPRRLGAAVLIGLALIALTTLVFQPANAQRGGELQPPFKIHFNEVSRPSRQLGPLPLTAPIITQTTFDSSFQLAYLLGSTTRWYAVNPSGSVTDYTWGRVAGEPITDSVWAMATNPPGLPPVAPGSFYTKNMEAYLVLGPLNLSDYGQIVLSMTYRLDVKEGDVFGVAYALPENITPQGTDWNAVAGLIFSDTELSSQHTGYWSLPNVARRNNVWLAFYFSSNNDDELGRGPYIEAMALRGAPLYKVFLPLMRLDPTPTPPPTPTPTPTATPASTLLYNYTFGSGLVSDPQFLTWGGKMNYTCGTGCDIIQDVSTNGNPNGSINFSQGGFNLIAGTAPNHVIPTNFELSGDFMLVEGKQDGRFGLIFGASLTTFYAEGDDVKMDPTRNYYKFDFNIDPDNETVIKSFRLQRYDNGSATNIVGGTDFPAGIVRGQGLWNTVRVVRQGGNIQIFVNGWPALNITDATFVGERKFGVHLHSRASNNNNNPFKIRFDNITVKQLP